MKYLVTGGAGFIGHHLSRHLAQQGHEVVVIDRIDSAGAVDRLSRVHQLEIVPGEGCVDIRLANGLVTFIRHDLGAGINRWADQRIGHVDYVVHLAAASHVDRSVADPWCFVQDNIMSTYHLLEWCRRRPIKKILHFSTDEVFGAAPPGRAFSEHDAHNPTNPYAATKAAAEMLCPAWANTFDLPIVLSHCTNVYGSGQDEEKFIPLVARKVQNGELVQIHADADCRESSTRYYLHVSDVCSAIDIMLQKGGVLGGATGGRYNISGDQELSNLHVATEIAGLLNKPLQHELVAFVPHRPRHDMRYAVRSDKLRELGWEPRVWLEAGLREALGL